MLSIQYMLQRNPVCIYLMEIPCTDMHFRRLCHKYASIAHIIMFAVSLYISLRRILNPAGNIDMEFYPVLPVQQEPSDSY